LCTIRSATPPRPSRQPRSENLKTCCGKSLRMPELCLNCHVPGATIDEISRVLPAAALKLSQTLRRTVYLAENARKTLP
jgi:hypothetical protein